MRYLDGVSPKVIAEVSVELVVDSVPDIEVPEAERVVVVVLLSCVALVTRAITAAVVAVAITAALIARVAALVKRVAR